MKKEMKWPINASLSCIDLAHVEQAMKEIEASAISGLHYDIVDGRFNTCLIFGDMMLSVFRKLTTKPILVHLACLDPRPYILPCIRNGADLIAVHYEAEADLKEVFALIREAGAKPVLAFRCDTAVPEDFLQLAKQADGILKLTVQPGFSGQVFHQEALAHIQEMRRQLTAAGMTTPIEADGNIHTETIKACVQAGATQFTCGSSGLFHEKGSLKENLKQLQQACEEGYHGINDE